MLRDMSDNPFEPMASTSLRHLTYKTVFLVAAASARRRSCLHALSVAVGHVRFKNHGVRLIPHPAFLPKNQTLNFVPGDIFLPRISHVSSVRKDKLWCPVGALLWYISRTKTLRTSLRLFIVLYVPYTLASRDTISRWIVQLI